ncbi:glycosyl hydrolase [Chitinophaga sp. MM2321]|uniref:glycoside hydrolase family 26 protein n=1 Tax=Chitinophaga sp. MM2321 TaxID=3137178 RepID=UPI0032D588B5
MKQMSFYTLLFSAVLSMAACSKSNNTTTTPPEKKDTVINTGFKTLDYLYSISGKKTLSGIHNREPNATPARWTEEIKNTTGKYPALWSGDFLFQADNINNRQIMIDEAVRQWNKGAVINLMWHACNPANTQPCGWDDGKGVQSRLTNEQWTELCTDGTVLNGKWKVMMDEVCVYLQQLEDKGVEVLWRPLHEMNQGVFWWGGRSGPDGTRKLWQLMRDYMTKTKGLSNLIWVWDIQDFPSLANDVSGYNPGAAYFDMVALDIYDDGSGYSQSKYEAMVKAAAGKPMAIGECQRLPTAAELRNQSRWVFFMGWSELTFSKNSTAEINNLYSADNIITLDKMPGWK